MKISDLVSKTGKASSWQSIRHGENLHVYHYSTLMAIVENGTFSQVSEGWGSQSDKCGMNKLRTGARKAGLTLG